MTLKDFLKVFDFDNPSENYPRLLQINTLEYDIVSKLDIECVAGNYHSKSEVEKDFCIALYDVIEIRPLGYMALQIVIAH